MDSVLWFKGLAIGFSIAAPVGPIGILCIRRTLTAGMTAGFLSGAGAATADAIYGSMAAYGLSVLSAWLMTYQRTLQLIGGLFLCYLGWRCCRQEPAQHMAGNAGGNWAAAYLSTLLLTLTNPMTILSFTAILSGLGLAAANAGKQAPLLVFGVFSGSLLWWLCLSGGVSLFRTALKPTCLRGINRISGLIILAFGIFSLAGR
ncbi:lysine-type exporter protein (lyse/ygga) [Lucifera butyrica]|uniref:Lysine-type exporter protein (Lyse/ygga) n=1 Tax=Lucifera butyrica TaxID=1351585 RepID=A0A498QYT0_9FIRM|nr:LysE family transporter [Lucifera butyrica]VBB05346.1 lysine-type exporter protein (lyse/ygga) [Lucifera butyrica]